MMYEYLLESIPENLKELQGHMFESYGGYQTHGDYIENLLTFIYELDDNNLKNIEFARDVIVPNVAMLDLEDMVEHKVARIAVTFPRDALTGFDYNIHLLYDVQNLYPTIPNIDRIYPKSSLPRLYLKTVNLYNSINNFEFDRRLYRQADDLGLGYSSEDEFKKAQANYLSTASEDQLDTLKMIIQTMNKLINHNFFH